MTIRARNYKGIVERGAWGGDADFEVFKCEVCDSYALYDSEKAQLYMDPHNLSKGSLYGIEDITCPGKFDVKCVSCGATNSFDETPDEDLGKVLHSPWAFLLGEPEPNNGT